MLLWLDEIGPCLVSRFTQVRILSVALIHARDASLVGATV